MTHEEAITLRDHLLDGEKLTDGDIDNFIAHLMEDESCEACTSFRQSISESKGWRLRSFSEFRALVIAAAMLRKG